MNTAQYPIFTWTNRKSLHISDDGQVTRCGRQCNRWGSEDNRNFTEGECRRCGSTADFDIVASATLARVAEREAARAEANRQSVRKYSAQAAQRRKLATAIATALRDQGYDVELDILPAGERTYVFTVTEFESVAFQVSVVEATDFANRVRAEQLAR